MSFLLGILTNSWVQKLGIYGIAIGAIFMAGFFFKGSCIAKKEVKETIDVLQDVIIQKDRVRRHHEKVPKDTVNAWNNILSGRTSLVCGKPKS